MRLIRVPYGCRLLYSVLPAWEWFYWNRLLRPRNPHFPRHCHIWPKSESLSGALRRNQRKYDFVHGLAYLSSFHIIFAVSYQYKKGLYALSAIKSFCNHFLFNIPGIEFVFFPYTSFENPEVFQKLLIKLRNIMGKPRMVYKMGPDTMIVIAKY